MAREHLRGAGAGGGESLGHRIGLFHCHQIQPAAFDGDAQDAGQADGAAGIAALGDEAGADVLERGVVGGVFFTAAFLIERAALRLAPEGAPGGEALGGADGGGEVGLDQGGELVGGGGASGFQGGLPVLAVFLGQIGQGFGQEALFGVEVEKDQPVRQACGACLLYTSDAADE